MKALLNTMKAINKMTREIVALFTSRNIAMDATPIEVPIAQIRKRINHCRRKKVAGEIKSFRVRSLF